MNTIEVLEVLVVGLVTLMVAVGLAASALNVLFNWILERERRSVAE
jgi:hypothetical protein